jgi:hypothetical protein
MYAADHVSQSPIVRIDPATGQTARVVQTTVNNIHGICIAPPPAARITREQDQIVATWPAWAGGYVLQSAPNRGADASWTPLRTVPATEGARVTAGWDLTDPARFFRLAGH